LPLEYKSINFEIKEIDNKGHFVGVASPYNNVDLGDDRVKASIAPRNANKTVPYLWTHNVEEPIGTVKLISTNTGMNIDGQLFLDTSTDGVPVIPNAFKAYKSMKSGILSNSIGYQVMPNGAEYVTENGKTIRDLVDIDIKEVSGVLFPMNEQAVISDVKSQNLDGGDNLTTENKGASGSTSLPMADKTIKWDGPAATKNVFDKYTDDKGNISADARKAFFWVDVLKPNEKGSYKLGFADIVNDKLTAIPAGVLAAANAIRGARNPVDIPEADKKKAATKINTYLKKLKYDEITDEQIKGEEGSQGGKSTSENIEHKEANPTEEKALGFADLLKIQNANDMRWKLQDALNTSFRQLMNDDTMTIDDKVKQLETNVDDFATAYKEAMKLVLQASANNKTAKKQVDEVLEIKQLEIETKAGKKISKANKDKIQRCKDGMTDLMSVLEDLLNNDVPEDDPDDPDNPGNDTGDEEDSKGCNSKVTGKSKNMQNMQEKENDVTLELKSSENLEILENISNLFKGDEQ